MPRSSTRIKQEAVEIIDITGDDRITEDNDQEIARLYTMLLKKKSTLSVLEAELAHKAHVVTKQEAYISKLEEHIQSLSKSVQAISQANLELLIDQGVLQEKLRAASDVRQMLEKSQHTTEILSSTLDKERAIKRHRQEEGVMARQ
jgi:hypothetical protein